MDEVPCQNLDGKAAPMIRERTFWISDGGNFVDPVRAMWAIDPENLAGEDQGSLTSWCACEEGAGFWTGQYVPHPGCLHCGGTWSPSHGLAIDCRLGLEKAKVRTSTLPTPVTGSENKIFALLPKQGVDAADAAKEFWEEMRGRNVLKLSKFQVVHVSRLDLMCIFGFTEDGGQEVLEVAEKGTKDGDRETTPSSSRAWRGLCGCLPPSQAEELGMAWLRRNEPALPSAKRLALLGKTVKRGDPIPKMAYMCLRETDALFREVHPPRRRAPVRATIAEALSRTAKEGEEVDGLTRKKILNAIKDRCRSVRPKELEGCCRYHQGLKIVKALLAATTFREVTDEQKHCLRCAQRTGFGISYKGMPCIGRVISFNPMSLYTGLSITLAEGQDPVDRKDLPDEPVRIVRVLLHRRTIWPVGQGLESVNKSLVELQAEEECDEEDEEDDEWM